MKRLKFLPLIIVLSVLTLLLISDPTYVDAANASFTNARTDTASLSVSKTVQNSTEGYEAPSATFSFKLQINSAPAASLSYTVYNASGSKVSTGKTDTNGTFTLTAGQKAVFEKLIEGRSYKVTESSVSGFTCSSPTGSSYSGTLVSGNTNRVFTNKYTPVTSGSGSCTFTINNNVGTVSGFNIGDNATFTYRLTVGGKLISGRSITAKKGSSSRTISIGSDGNIQLKSGEQAVIDGLPSGLAYTVQQVSLPSGYWLNSKSNDTGKTASPSSAATFNSQSESFAVATSVEGYPSDTNSFTYILTGSGGSVMSNVKYAIFNTSSKSKVSDKTTGSNGKFTVQAGQTAIFLGLGKGKQYSVQQESNTAYTQKVPTQSEGYQNKTVQQSPETLPFINVRKENVSGLTVKKEVTNTTSQSAPASDTFSFTIKGSNGKALANQQYKLSTSDRSSTTVTKTTDSNGVFILKNQEYAQFQNLASGSYTIEETDQTLLQSKGYTFNAFTYNSTTSNQSSVSVSIPWNSSVTLTCKNNYAPVALTTLKIEKQVTGSMADANRSFNFTLNLGEQNPYVTYSAVLDSGGTRKNVTVSSGNNKFSLKDGDTFTVSRIMKGTTYQVTEDSTVGYKTYINWTKDGVNQTQKQNVQTAGKITAGGKADTQVFVNNCTSTVPTGVISYLVPFAILAVCGLTLAYLLTGKRKK